MDGNTGKASAAIEYITPIEVTPLGLKLVRLAVIECTNPIEAIAVDGNVVSPALVESIIPIEVTLLPIVMLSVYCILGMPFDQSR